VDVGRATGIPARIDRDELPQNKALETQMLTLV
jgi:hypothetical protein